MEQKWSRGGLLHGTAQSGGASCWPLEVCIKKRAEWKCVSDFPGSGIQGCAVARSGRSQRSTSRELRDAKLRIITLGWACSLDGG